MNSEGKRGDGVGGEAVGSDEFVGISQLGYGFEISGVL